MSPTAVGMPSIKSSHKASTSQPGAARDVLVLAFLRKGSCNMKEVQANKEPQGEKWQAAAGAGGWLPEWQSSWAPRYSATILETSINRRGQINISVLQHKTWGALLTSVATAAWDTSFSMCAVLRFDPRQTHQKRPLKTLLAVHELAGLSSFAGASLHQGIHAHLCHGEYGCFTSVWELSSSWKETMDVYIFKKGLFLPLSIINGSQVRLRNNARDKLPCTLFIYALPNCFLLS